MADLTVPGRRGITIPDTELVERFSRSSGPGGQSVNTTDSRVELRWDVGASAVLDDHLRARLLDRLAPRLNDGVLSIVASEQRSQLQNREAARGRLVNLLREALAPPPPPRRPSKPSRRARARRVDAKKQRGDLKVTRRRPPADGPVGRFAHIRRLCDARCNSTKRRPWSATNRRPESPGDACWARRPRPPGQQPSAQ